MKKEILNECVPAIVAGIICAIFFMWTYVTITILIGINPLGVSVEFALGLTVAAIIVMPLVANN